MEHVGIVGAGVAGCAAAYALRGADTTVTVFEAGSRVGGRAATRHRGEITYDYGANYVKDDDPSVVALLTDTLPTDGLVEAAGPIWTFDREGTVTEGRPSDAHKWTYRAGIGVVADRLLAAGDATVELETAVDHLSRSDDGWHLRDEDGVVHQPFDALVLTPPAPLTAELVARADWTSETRPSLAAAIDAVPYRSIWSAVLGYEFALDVPYYALVNPAKDHAIGWISREECKPGHVPPGHSVLVVQANHDWSVDQADTRPADAVAELAGRTAEVIDEDRLAEPTWTDHRLWHHALAERAVDPDALEDATAAGLYFAGDWIAGEGRVHAAIRSGLTVGDRIVDDR